MAQPDTKKADQWNAVELILSRQVGWVFFLILEFEALVPVPSHDMKLLILTSHSRHRRCSFSGLKLTLSRNRSLSGIPRVHLVGGLNATLLHSPRPCIPMSLISCYDSKTLWGIFTVDFARRLHPPGRWLGFGLLRRKRIRVSHWVACSIDPCEVCTWINRYDHLWMFSDHAFVFRRIPMSTPRDFLPYLLITLLTRTFKQCLLSYSDSIRTSSSRGRDGNGLTCPVFTRIYN